MKIALITAAMLAGAAFAADVTYVGQEKVAAALAKGGPLVTQSDVLVSGSHRDKGGQVEVHDWETDDRQGVPLSGPEEARPRLEEPPGGRG